MGTIIILPETTKNPITLMGARAGCCWNANIAKNERNYKRGLDCIKSGHGRVMEYPNVEMIIDGYSAKQSVNIIPILLVQADYRQVQGILIILKEMDLIM